jgi:hypothetical protein
MYFYMYIYVYAHPHTHPPTHPHTHTAHRKLIVSLHPDRVAALPEEEQVTARKKFEKVQAAYESLGGGSGDSVESWYENLGTGRADFFSGPVDLTKPFDASILDFWAAAVCPIDTEVCA